MARRDRAPLTSGAAGRDALAVHRDDDMETFVSLVRYLPTLAKEKGYDFAIGWAQTEIRPSLSMLGLAEPKNEAEMKARASVALFFHEGSLRLLCDGDGPSYRWATDFIAVVERELFERSVRAVFARSAADNDAAYVPSIPVGGGP